MKNINKYFFILTIIFGLNFSMHAMEVKKVENKTKTLQKVNFDNVFILYITSEDYIENLKTTIGDIERPPFRKQNFGGKKSNLTRDFPSGPYVNPDKIYILNCHKRDSINSKEIMSYLEEYKEYRKEISCAVFYVADIDENALKEFINFLYKQNPTCLQNKLVLFFYTTCRGDDPDYYNNTEWWNKFINQENFKSEEPMVHGKPNICIIYASQPQKAAFCGKYSQNSKNSPTSYFIRKLKTVCIEQSNGSGRVRFSSFFI